MTDAEKKAFKEYGEAVSNLAHLIDKEFPEYAMTLYLDALITTEKVKTLIKQKGTVPCETSLK